ncbi:MAG: twin-arginine translocase subunit TatC [Bacteroidota bacterium]
MALLTKFTDYRQQSKKEVKEEEKEMSFLDHLEELRWHLFRSVIAIAVCALAVGINIQWIFDNVIYYPLQYEFPTHQFLCQFSSGACEGNILGDLIAIKPTEQFLKSIGISIILGIIVAFPYLIWEVWRFIKPGLHKHERRGMRGNVAIMSLLFFTGICFAYYIILPFAIKFLAAFSISDQVANTWRFGEVISLITQVVIAGGIVFEMPIVVYYLSKLGFVTPEGMKRYRKIAIVVLLVLSAVITPPDVISQVLIFFPLMGLYQLSIAISRRVQRGAEKAELAALEAGE